MDYQVLNLLLRCGREFSHERIRRRELSDTECMLCSYIYLHEGCSQEEASSALKTDKTTVGKALASLESKACVMRTQDGTDRRIKRLSLTGLGRKRVTEPVDIHNNWLRDIMACLSPEEQKRFEDYCERLLAAAEKMNVSRGNGG